MLMLLAELVEKHGFKLDSNVKGTDGYINTYKSKDFIIEEYVTEESITCYLLNKNRNHVLDVQPNTDGIFNEWDDYLCQI
jgi:hypothetical protein